MLRWIVGILVAVVAALALAYLGADKETRNLLANLPTDRNVLFWSVPQRDAAFRTMDRIPVLAKARVVAAGSEASAIAAGDPLELEMDVDQYMLEQRTAGLIIVQGGRLRMEKYGLDFDAEGRWTSFSVAKSFTSTMVGAAIKDGFINSVDDIVSEYIPDLRGSAYDEVSISQLLTMTSGVAWNEDYEDRNSDVARFNEHQADADLDVTVSYMRSLARDVPAGEKWVYKTGETNLIGVLVSAATGKHLADYLSEKIWVPYGMEQDATWLLGSTEHEIGGCCLQAATRDFARFGLFMLGGAVVAGDAVLPEGWLSAATSKQADIGRPGRGYGYQWWTYDDGSYAAQGIFGQGIFIDPSRDLVIASNSNWPRARGNDGQSAQRQSFYRAVQAAVDRE